MDKERCKSKSQMVSIKACCQDAAWASFSLRVGELGTQEEPRAGQDRTRQGLASQGSVQLCPGQESQGHPNVVVRFSIHSVFSFMNDFYNPVHRDEKHCFLNVSVPQVQLL